MSALKLERLPRFDVPELTDKKVGSVALQEWMTWNMEFLVRNGVLERRRHDPLCAPVNRPFVLL